MKRLFENRRWNGLPNSLQSSLRYARHVSLLSDNLDAYILA